MTINVLFLCTGNSCRSIMAESLLRFHGGGQFASYSAGSFPAGTVNPKALALLHERGHDTSMLRSKNWDEFECGDSLHFHYIFTLCDNAAEEPCPVWSGRPATAHWGLSDPSDVTGSADEINEAYERAFATIERRIKTFIDLPDLIEPDEDTLTKIHQIGLN